MGERDLYRSMETVRMSFLFWMLHLGWYFIYIVTRLISYGVIEERELAAHRLGTSYSVLIRTVYIYIYIL